MLGYELLKNHAGLALISDYKSLQNFYEVVHEVNEKSVLVKDKEGSFLGLAYDLRKAFEKQRRVYQPPGHTPEIGPRFGVEILWPVILVQCRMLRASLAFFDSSKKQQACAFELEHVLEEALRTDFGPESESIKEQWERIDPSHPFVEEHYQGRSGLYCSWGKAERKKGLAGLLASLDPAYPRLYPIWVRNGAKDLVSPQELDKWDDAEWPDPNW